jgi:hypothetical protein
MTDKNNSKRKSSLLSRILKTSVRTMFYGLLTVLLLLSIAFAWTQSEAFDQFVAAELSHQLDQTFETPISIGGVTTDLIGGRIIIHDIIAASESAQNPPVSIKSLSASIDLFAIMGGRLLIPQISIYRPQVKLYFDAQGNLVLPRLRAKPAEEEIGENQNSQLELGVVNLSAGSLSIQDQELNFDIEAGQVILNLISTSSESYKGKTRISGLSLRLPQFHHLKTTMINKFAFDAETLTASILVEHESGAPLLNSDLFYDFQSRS